MLFAAVNIIVTFEGDFVIVARLLRIVSFKLPIYLVFSAIYLLNCLSLHGFVFQSNHATVSLASWPASFQIDALLKSVLFSFAF